MPVVTVLVVLVGRLANLVALVDAELCQGLADLALGDLLAVEFHPHGAGRAGLRFQYAGQGAEVIGDGLRAALVSDALDLPQPVAEAFRDPRAGRCHEFADTGQRQRIRIVVNA